jgi:hypothetical protein
MTLSSQPRNVRRSAVITSVTGTPSAMCEGCTSELLVMLQKYWYFFRDLVKKKKPHNNKQQTKNNKTK